MEHTKHQLGEYNLWLRPGENGSYELVIGDGETETVALSLLQKERKIAGHVLHSYHSKVYLDHNDDTVYRMEELLTPGNRPKVIVTKDGRLFCRVCQCYVPNTANHEMRKEGAFAHSHTCGVRKDGEIYI